MLSLLLACAPVDPAVGLRVSTLNAGTSSDLAPGDPDAATADEHYGNGLAWSSAIDSVAEWVAAASPDLLGLQEVFHPGDCAAVPEEAWPGFVCETWTAGDPSVAATVTGESYEVACHPGAADKCVALASSAGEWSGCDAEGCLHGEPVEGCGSRVRVAWGDVELLDGSALRVIHVHGTSGLSPEDIDCRVAQAEQAAAASAGTTLLVGDLNTDPLRLDTPDAVAWREAFSGWDWPAKGLEATYLGAMTIDHVALSSATATCEMRALERDGPPSDHDPLLCSAQP